MAVAAVLVGTLVWAAGAAATAAGYGLWVALIVWVWVVPLVLLAFVLLMETPGRQGPRKLPG